MKPERRWSSYSGLLGAVALGGVARSRMREMLGRRPLRYRSYVQRLAYLIKSGIVGSNCALTCVRGDGAGAQAHGRMSVIAFSRVFRLPYVHTPFECVEHTRSAEYVRRWEELFAFNRFQESTEQCCWPSVDLARYVNSPDLWSKNTLVECLYMHPYMDRNPDVYRLIKFKLMEFYSGRSGSRLHNTVRVAVHIRRGDVNDSVLADRYTKDSNILGVIASIKQSCIMLNSTPVVSVYSQGAAESFDIFRRDGCELHIGADEIWTFNQLVQADVLIMAKSSFSYAAALLSKGAVIYEPFWHKPLRSWVSIDPSRGIDNVALVDVLRERGSTAVAW